MKTKHRFLRRFPAWLAATWLACAAPVFAQNAEQTLAFARQQVAEGNTALAAKTYQRLVFFTGDRYREECYAQLAALFFQSADFAKSEQYFDLLYHAARTDSLRFEAIFGKASALLLQQEHRKSLLELFALPADLPENWRVRRALYLGAAHFGARDFGAAEAALLEILPPENAAARVHLHQLMDKARRIDRKNPKTARILSMVLPGAGQFYAGDIKNGLNSLMLNALLAYWFAATAQGYSFFDASFTVMPWLFRYHAGGYKRTAAILEHQKDERLRRTFRSILSLVR